MPGGKKGRGTYAVIGKNLILNFDNSMRDEGRASPLIDSMDVEVYLFNLPSNDTIQLNIEFSNTWSKPHSESRIFYKGSTQGTLYSDSKGKSKIKILNGSIVECNTCILNQESPRIDEIEIGESQSQRKLITLTELSRGSQTYKLAQHEFYYNQNDSMQFRVKRKSRKSFQLSRNSNEVDKFIKYQP